MNDLDDLFNEKSIRLSFQDLLKPQYECLNSRLDNKNLVKPQLNKTYEVKISAPKSNI